MKRPKIGLRAKISVVNNDIERSETLVVLVADMHHWVQYDNTKVAVNLCRCEWFLEINTTSPDNVCTAYLVILLGRDVSNKVISRL